MVGLMVCLLASLVMSINFHGQNRRNAYRKEADIECYTNPDGSDYRGKKSMCNFLGMQCEKWSDQRGFTVRDYPNAGLEGAYCRNPDLSESTAWCIIKDHNSGVTVKAKCDIGRPSIQCGKLTCIQNIIIDTSIYKNISSVIFDASYVS
uniref:Plasminogen-like n=1 Tax=Saccoglossus kowalevskii TaxID=10224 RepID=A0ABM0M7U5_SACKO|nr:PREDICTED: plasminogen-like [Saccoglossus kowalevskii]